MSDIWSAVQWWDEWQLRILVLGSLSFQWFLVLVVPMRNHTVQSWLRACILLASICADVLAIYALATLLHRQAAGRWIISVFDGDDYSRGRAQQVRSSLPLEALWAPLLLVHLGGREELTASGMDDGDTALWLRHAAVLVTVTVYALFTSLRYFSDISDGGFFKLLASAALLLVAAVVSSCGKPWVLRRASVRRLVAMSSLAKGGRKTKHRPSGGGGWCFAELGDRYKCWKELKPRGTTPMLSHGDKVQMLLSGMSLHAARATLETRKAKPDQEILEPFDMIKKPWLRQALGLIYTRAAVTFTPAYLACHALLVPSLYVSAAVLFFFAASNKKRGYSIRSSYSRADVNTTYALMCFTAALDVFGMFVSEMVHSLLASSCENLPGHNLMDSVLWTIRRPILSMLLLRCYKGGSFGKDNDRMYARVLDMIRNKLEDRDKDKNKVEGKDTSTNKVEDKDKDDKEDDEGKDITIDKVEEDHDKDNNKDDKMEDKDITIDLVCNGSTNKVEDEDEDRDRDREKDNKVKDKDSKDKDKDKDKDKNFDLDLSSYRSLSKRNWILRDEDLKEVRKKPSEDLKVVRGTNKDDDDDNNIIRDSLRKQPFDASVLIWHIATDLCFRVKPPNYFRFRPLHDEQVAREVCTEAISNYMAYLLDSCPEMLMAGSRQHLFTEAMANMERVVGEATKGLRPKLGEKQPLDGVILGKIREEAGSLKDKEAYTVIDDACKLANQLLGIQEETSRWELMHRVWVGMLCYSAAMCRGELHAKSLGEGGEFLSSVWLLISLIGGRNLADKLQMPDEEDPEQPEGKVGEAPARDKKEEQKAEAEAAAAKVQKPDSEPKNNRKAGFFSRPT